MNPSQLPKNAKARFGKGNINQIQFSPDSTILAVASSIGIWVYETDTYQEIALLTEHTDDVKSLAFSPNGKILASGGGWDDKTIYLWDTTTGQFQKTLKGHTGAVTSLAFSPDGKTLASGSLDKNNLSLGHRFRTP